MHYITNACLRTLERASHDIDHLFSDYRPEESHILLIGIVKRVVFKFEEKNTLIYSHLFCIGWSTSSRYSTAFINGSLYHVPL